MKIVVNNKGMKALQASKILRGRPGITLVHGVPLTSYNVHGPAIGKAVVALKKAGADYDLRTRYSDLD